VTTVGVLAQDSSKGVPAEPNATPVVSARSRMQTQCRGRSVVQSVPFALNRTCAQLEHRSCHATCTIARAMQRAPSHVPCNVHHGAVHRLSSTSQMMWEMEYTKTA
jgi:hypothetical protein